MRGHRLKVLALGLVVGCGAPAIVFRLHTDEVCEVGDIGALRVWVSKCIADGPKSVVDEDLHWQARCARTGEGLFSVCTKEFHPEYLRKEGCIRWWERCDRLPKDHPTRVECERKRW